MVSSNKKQEKQFKILNGFLFCCSPSISWIRSSFCQRSRWKIQFIFWREGIGVSNVNFHQQLHLMFTFTSSLPRYCKCMLILLYVWISGDSQIASTRGQDIKNNGNRIRRVSGQVSIYFPCPFKKNQCYRYPAYVLECLISF